VWVPGLSINGVHNQWLSHRFIHFCATSVPSMREVCIGGRKNATSGTFMFPTTDWNDVFQAIVMRVTDVLRRECGLDVPVPNFIMGRLYATNGSWSHTEHTDGATQHYPDRRYISDTSVISIGTAGAPLHVCISETPCSTDMKGSSSFKLIFPELDLTSAHVWAMVSLGNDQGALRVRHSVNVLKNTGANAQHRIALVCRSVRPYQSGALQLFRMSLTPWLRRAQGVLISEAAQAIQWDLAHSYLGDQGRSKLRSLLCKADDHGWPTGVLDNLCSKLAPVSLNGKLQEGALLSAQPHILRHCGYHHANKGLSLSAVQIPPNSARWVATAILINFKSWFTRGDEIISSGRYHNVIRPRMVVCQGPDSRSIHLFHEAMHNAEVAHTPVRVLVKVSLSNLPPFVDFSSNSHHLAVYALCLAYVTRCDSRYNRFELSIPTCP
jgi:hypothetical protein